jgi:hypothetical protein
LYSIIYYSKIRLAGNGKSLYIHKATEYTSHGQTQDNHRDICVSGRKSSAVLVLLMEHDIPVTGKGNA